MKKLKRAPTPFSKYDEMGAYHWIQCDRSSPHFNPPLEARYRVVLQRIGRAERVLDLGCGDGYLMGLIRPLTKQIIGADSEFSGLALAREKLTSLSSIQIIGSSCYELPFRDQRFDLILLTDVIEHLEQPAECLSEIRRVLTLKGTLLITTPRWRPDRMWDTSHVREFKPEEMRRILEPFFSQVPLKFFWPLFWFNLCATRYGWHLIRLFSRFCYNPFLREGDSPEKYGQILAICKGPR